MRTVIVNHFTGGNSDGILFGGESIWEVQRK